MDHSTPTDLLDRGIKLRHLVFVIAVADAGTVVGAATALHVTQPVVSRTLQEIETVLGVALFERLPKGTVPTAYGETFVRHARAVLGQLRQASRDINLLARGELGSVSIGTHLAGSNVLLPHAVAALKAKHPTLTVVIEEGTPEALARAALHGRLDLILGRLTSTAPEGLQQELLYLEPIRFVARTDHPIHTRPDPSLAELIEYPWILPGRQTALRAELEQLFASEGLALPTNIIECTSPLTVWELLSTTNSIGALPELVARQSAGIECIAREAPTVRRSVGVTYSALATLTPGGRALLKQLRHTATTLT